MSDSLFKTSMISGRRIALVGGCTIRPADHRASQPLRIPADLVFDPTLAHGGFRFGRSGVPTTDPLPRETLRLGQREVRLTSRTSHDRPGAHARTYVDPFGLVCHGLGRTCARNHRPGMTPRVYRKVAHTPKAVCLPASASSSANVTVHRPASGTPQAHIAGSEERGRGRVGGVV